MKRLIYLLFIAALAACQNSTGSGKRVTLSTSADSTSYGIGVQVAQSLKPAAADINTDAFMMGLTDGLKADGEPLLTEVQVNKLIRQFQTTLQQKAQAERQAAGDKNKTEGEVFLAENAKKPGVITTASGLQYKVIKEGSGKSPAATSTVVTHYRGTFIDGKQFDSSYDRGEPATFALNQVIKGWTEGIQLMKPGAKYEFYIPSELAYGTRGYPPHIAPNATLIFEVELLEVK